MVLFFFMPDLLNFSIFFFNLFILRRRSLVNQGRFLCFSVCVFSGIFSKRVLDRQVLKSSQRCYVVLESFSSRMFS